MDFAVKMRLPGDQAGAQNGNFETPFIKIIYDRAGQVYSYLRYNGPRNVSSAQMPSVRYH